MLNWTAASPLSEWLPRFIYSRIYTPYRDGLLPNDKHQFSRLRCRPASPAAFSDSDLIIYDHSRQSVANTTFLQDGYCSLPTILNEIACKNRAVFFRRR